MVEDLKAFWQEFCKYRYLLSELIKKGITLKYRRSYLGVLWSLLEPLLTMIVLTIVFGAWYGRGDHTFPVYVLTGRLLYSYFSNSTKAAMKSIQNNGRMIRKIYVPKYIYPLSNIISNFIIFLISLIVLVGVSIVLKIQPTIYLLQAIVPLILLFILSIGVSLILATMDVFFKDMEYLWSVALMLVMYSSAIFYQPERIIKNGYGWIFNLNPVFHIVQNFRDAVLWGQPMNTTNLMYAAAYSFGSLLIGLYVFRKKQDDFILYI